MSDKPPTEAQVSQAARLMGRAGKGKPKIYTPEQLKAASERLARGRLARWPAPKTQEAA